MSQASERNEGTLKALIRMERLFEAFFWIEPQRAEGSTAFESTRVVWHYPQDVRHVTQAFRDIPKFCFPDLETVGLERPVAHRSEFFTFALTDAEGTRMYGVCMRPFFRGESLRYDVKRRARHCLCIVTQRPLFALLRTVLLQLHGLTMLDAVRPGSTALMFLSALFAATPDRAAQLVVSRSQVPAMPRDFCLQLPRGRSAAADASAPILPILECLGVDRFLLLLGALLCERRVLFVADGIERLSSSVLAAASMLQPFEWQHVFIPLLPSGLLDYVSAPMPYVIGVRRSLLPRLERMALEACVIVDVDQGTLRTVGRVQLRDMVGESASKSKQASETMDSMVKAGTGFVNKLMGRTDAQDTLSQGPRDLMVVVLQDLGRALSSKPGADTLRGVASGLVSKLAGTNKAPDEARLEWQQEAERIVRESLLLFYTYLFADAETFVAKPQSQPRGPSNSSPSRERSNSFDMRGFISRRAQLGDSRELQDFLTEFRQSQMFERFCEGRARKTAAFPAGTSSTEDEEDDQFDSLCRETRKRHGLVTIGAARSVIQARSSRLAAAYAHPPSLAFIDEGAPSQPAQAMLERAVADASSDQLLKILRLVAARLEACRAASGRGTAGAGGLRALTLLRVLLVSGSQAALSGALDLLPLIRQLLRPSMGPAKTTGLGSALQGMLTLPYTDVRPAAHTVLSILIDHRLLQHQRLFARLVREGRFPFMRVAMQRIRHAPLSSFAALHQACRPSPAVCGTPWAVASLRLTSPRLGASDVDDKERPPVARTIPTSSRTSFKASTSSNVQHQSSRLTTPAAYADLPDAGDGGGGGGSDFEPSKPTAPAFAPTAAPPPQRVQAPAPIAPSNGTPLPAHVAATPVPVSDPFHAFTAPAPAQAPLPSAALPPVSVTVTTSEFAPSPLQASSQAVFSSLTAVASVLVSVPLPIPAAAPTPAPAPAPAPVPPPAPVPVHVFAPTQAPVQAAIPKREITWVTQSNGDLSPVRPVRPHQQEDDSAAFVPTAPAPSATALLRGFGPPGQGQGQGQGHGPASPPHGPGSVLLRGFGPSNNSNSNSNIPPEFRVVNRDTGEVTDLRQLSAPAMARPSGATVEQRMHAIYAKFNPEKVGDIPMLLSKYKGHEMEMLARLEAKYAPVPVFVGGVQIHPASPNQAGEGPSTLLQQLSMPAPTSTNYPAQLTSARSVPVPAPAPVPHQPLRGVTADKPRDPFADLVSLGK